jgi:hypothetical protein
MTRRLRRITFHASFLLDLCKEGSGLRCMNGIPEDAQVEGIALEEDGVTVTISSESFAPVDEGKRIPRTEPTFVSHD